MNIEERFRGLMQEVREKEGSWTKIAVIGQPGAGKSSLINNLLGERVAQTGPDTDNTTEVQDYPFSFVKIYDTPGYGTERFNFEEWKKQVGLASFDALVFVFSEKFKEKDDALLKDLQTCENPLFLVRNYSETLPTAEERAMVEQDLRLRLPNFDKLYFVSCGRRKEGLEALRKAVLDEGLKDLWKKRLRTAFENAKIFYLEQAKKNASDKIDTYKKWAAINCGNPILGLDISVDIGLYLNMFADIRAIYGIDQQDFSKYTFVPIAGKLLTLLAKEGILLLLKNFGPKYIIKTFLRYFPFLGLVIGIPLGWKLCKVAGENYSEDCSTFAQTVMQKLIEEELNVLWLAPNCSVVVEDVEKGMVLWFTKK